MNFTINLGLIASPISEQLAKQGFIVEERVASRWQNVLRAIALLSVGNYITPEVRRKTEWRLVHEIETYLSQLNQQQRGNLQ